MTSFRGIKVTAILDPSFYLTNISFHPKETQAEFQLEFFLYFYWNVSHD
jgi:hypothetical protein